jgi:PhzF family phenazine biosynthesis protein
MNEGLNLKIARIAAFSHQDKGGNPAGVVICDVMPGAEQMLKIAKEVGYSETAFLHKHNDGWRIRYFAPEMEVAFCGHATIASGFALGEQHGEGRYKLFLNDGDIDVSVEKTTSQTLYISLSSPKTFSEPAPSQYSDSILNAFGFSPDDLDPNFPTYFASAGAKHLIVVLQDHQRLASMNYEFEIVKHLMAQEQLVTINLLWKASSNQFHSRNAFAAGGVYEDPATGAAAAAFAGYLRDIAWSGDTSFEIFQGEDMGFPSRLLVQYQPEIGSSIKVSGEARYLVA